MTGPVTNPCPRCASPHVVAGTIMGDRWRASAFKPAGVRFWTFTGTVLALLAPAFLEPNGKACVACGLVWTEVDARALRTVLREAGTDETRARFGAALDEPPAGER